jgi:hypothetical protein
MSDFLSGRNLLIGHGVPDAPTANTPEMQGAMRASGRGLPQYRAWAGWHDVPIAVSTTQTRRVGPGEVFTNINAAMDWALAHVKATGGTDGIVLETTAGLVASAPLLLRGANARHIRIIGAGISVPVSAMTGITPSAGGPFRAWLFGEDSDLPQIDCPITCANATWTGDDQDLGPSGERLIAVVAQGGSFSLGAAGVIDGFTTAASLWQCATDVRGVLNGRRRGLILGDGTGAIYNGPASVVGDPSLSVTNNGAAQGVEVSGGTLVVRGAVPLRRGTFDAPQDIVVSNGGKVALTDAGILGGTNVIANYPADEGLVLDVRAPRQLIGGGAPISETDLNTLYPPAQWTGWLASTGEKLVHSDGTAWRLIADQTFVESVIEDELNDVFEFSLVDKILYVDGSSPEIEGEQYQTIGAACQYLSRFLPPYKANWQQDRPLRNLIVIRSGHVVNEQLRFEGVNFSQTAIIAEDATVTINPAGLSKVTQVGDGSHAFITITPSSAGPTILTQFVLGAGAVPQDAQAIADGVVPNNYTPNPVWCSQQGVLSIGAQTENQFQQPVNPPRCGGAQGAWYITLSTGHISRTNVSNARISSSTGTAWYERGVAIVARSVIRGAVRSVLCTGRLVISTVGAGAGQMPDNGDWGQDFRRDPASDSQFDLVVESGGLIRVPANARGGFSQAPNVWTRNGFVVFNDGVDAVRLLAGAASQPGAAFENDLDTGLFRPAENVLGIATGGAERVRVTSAGLEVTGLITGTAVTQSATDTTAGRLLTTGAGPAQAFRRGNILGAVSQSGGVPTGAVIERGSNANGTFVRFADGTLICTQSIDLGSRLAFGSGTYADPYRTNATTWTFPAAFAAAPVLQITPLVNSTVGTQKAHTGVAQSVSATAATGVQAVACAGVATDLDVTAHLVAIGRWF